MRNTFYFLVGVALTLTAGLVFAQAPIPVTVSVTSSATTSPANITVTWNAPGAATCSATGNWSGIKAASGVQVFQAQLNGVYTYILTCSASSATAKLAWTPPTHNTDGTPLTNLASYDVLHADTAAGVDTATPIVVPAPAVGYTVTGLPAGTRHFGVKSVNAQGVKSVVSLKVSTTFTLPSGTGSGTITLLPQPQPPVVTVEQVAYAVKPNEAKLAFVLDGIVGTVPLGVPCDRTRTTDGAYYAVNRAKYVTWTTNRRPTTVVVRCG